MKNKQTAVEWLVNELENHHVFHDIKNTVAYQQAKEMEKEQIMAAYSNNGWNDDDPMADAEQYYNETYGGNK
jgi:hypothetical protein